MQAQSNIQFMDYKKLLQFRHEVLTPHIPVEQCWYPTDPDALHLGYIKNEKLIGACTFFKEPYPTLNPQSFQNVYRLRQMGVSPQYQRQGIGQALMEQGFLELKIRKSDYLWCKAREVAFSFYQSFGFKFLSTSYDIPNIGPHRDMGVSWLK